MSHLGAKTALFRRTLLVAALGALLVAMVVDRVVAVVGDEIITERELNEAYQDDSLNLMQENVLSGSSAEENLSRAEYLDRMIAHKLIEQEVERQGIEVDDMDVERAIERKRKGVGLSEEEFRQALSSQGIDMDQYRQSVREQLITYRLISKEVKGEIEVSDRAVRAYYNQHPEQFMAENSYHLYLIFMRFPSVADEDKKKEIIEEMRSIRSKIGSLAEFQDMARRHSQASSAPRGGDIGYFTLEEMLDLFQKRVKNLSAGEMTPVFYDNSGVYLIYLADVKKGKKLPLSEVRDRIHSILYQQESKQRYQIWLERLKARTYTENRLEQEKSSP
ncbi:MAG: SurA N-terminal domain-containing protein [bacterium]